MLLERKSELLPAAISALLLGVSEFFRDAGVFQTLERTILPQLALHRKDLRIWSAACSDGQEVYSVAILLAELGLLNSSHLLGSDCRVDAIDRAKKGIYDEHAMHQVKDPFRQRYFLRQGSGHFVSPELRERTSWKRCDLAAEIEPGPWDMILFRNVAIYLNADSARAIWNRLAEALAIGGVLVVGKAERPDCQVPLERVDHCVYRRTGG